ncbi:MAG: PIN domain-containing protein [Flavobacterium sp.]
MSEDNKNNFIYNRHFPESKSILLRKGKGIKEIFKSAIFVLDANSLLAPYNIGKENIEEIGKTYLRLISKEKLYIPEHALKEFAKNRSTRISELFTNIDNHLSNLPSIKLFEYPILGELDPYKKLKTNRDTILDQIKDYKKNLEDLKSGIIDWNWSDPVTTMYQSTFNETIIISPLGSEEELSKEYNERIHHEIPPGNKDKSKEKNAIGDFLIWKSILELGKEKKTDIIFVSNDEKNDWLLKGNQKSISTKFELVDEYFRYTEGYDFMSITFKSFLELEGLNIDISQIFTEFDEIFKTNKKINYDKNSSLKTLEVINTLINDYLNVAEENLYESYIDQNINSQIEIFLNTYKLDFFDTPEWSFYFDYFYLFTEWLKEIKSLNNVIIYNTYRHKRDTRTESIKMLALCKEFTNKYLDFELLS